MNEMNEMNEMNKIINYLINIGYVIKNGSAYLPSDKEFEIPYDVRMTHFLHTNKICNYEVHEM